MDNLYNDVMKPKPTKQQLEDLLAKGLSCREIAEIIYSTTTTVGRYIRKYNLQTNTRTGVRPGSKQFLCNKCGETDATKFRKHWFSISYSKCKKCHSAEQVARYTERRLETIKFFGGRCCCCGYDKYHGSLHFHHLDPSQKDPSWKNLKNKPLNRIVNELKKCVLVCANCHGEIEAGLRTV